MGPGGLPAVYSDSRFAFDGMERKAGTALECTPSSKDQTFALLVTVGDEASIFTRLVFLAPKLLSVDPVDPLARKTVIARE